MLKWNGGSNTPNLNMKKYKILTDTMAGGSKVHAGDIVELNDSEGHSLCAYNKAEIHVAKPKAKNHPKVAPVPQMPAGRLGFQYLKTAKSCSFLKKNIYEPTNIVWNTIAINEI